MADRVNGPYLSYVVPGSKMEPAVARAQREQIAAALVNMAIGSGGFARGPAELVVREGLPSTDYNLTNDVWITAALTANTQIAGYLNQQLANNQVAAFFGVMSDPIAPAVRPCLDQLLFAVGASGATPLARFQLEHLWAEQELVGYFSEAIFYKPLQTAYASITPRITNANGEYFTLYSFICEPKGLTINAVL